MSAGPSEPSAAEYQTLATNRMTTRGRAIFRKCWCPARRDSRSLEGFIAAAARGSAARGGQFGIVALYCATHGEDVLRMSSGCPPLASHRGAGRERGEGRERTKGKKDRGHAAHGALPLSPTHRTVLVCHGGVAGRLVC